jgi:hypothetical protein
VVEEAVMRSALLLSIALGCIVFALPANAVPPGKHQADARQPIIKIAQKCPPGSWWIPEGYQRKGKWKPGHCSKVTTRSN